MKIKKILIAVLIALFLLLGVYWLWSGSGRAVPRTPINLQIQVEEEFGDNTEEGNIVGIQPYMFPADYASESNFYAKLNGYFQKAQEKGRFYCMPVLLLCQRLHHPLARA